MWIEFGRRGTTSECVQFSDLSVDKRTMAGDRHGRDGVGLMILVVEGRKGVVRNGLAALLVLLLVLLGVWDEESEWIG